MTNTHCATLHYTYLLTYDMLVKFISFYSLTAALKKIKLTIVNNTHAFVVYLHRSYSICVFATRRVRYLLLLLPTIPQLFRNTLKNFERSDDYAAEHCKYRSKKEFKSKTSTTGNIYIILLFLFFGHFGNEIYIFAFKYCRECVSRVWRVWYTNTCIIR